MFEGLIFAEHVATNKINRLLFNVLRWNVFAISIILCWEAVTLHRYCASLYSFSSTLQIGADPTDTDDTDVVDPAHQHQSKQEFENKLTSM